MHPKAHCSIVSLSVTFKIIFVSKLQDLILTLQIINLMCLFDYFVDIRYVIHPFLLNYTFYSFQVIRELIILIKIFLQAVYLVA